MTIHNRRLKQITFDLGGTEFQCQVKSWKLTNNTKDGEKIYSFCPTGEDVEETEPDWALELAFYADWRSAGISDYLTLNDGSNISFQIDHHPDIVGEHVRRAGTVRLKAPSVGGEARTTELTEVTLQCIGVPVYSRP